MNVFLTTYIPFVFPYIYTGHLFIKYIVMLSKDEWLLLRPCLLGSLSDPIRINLYEMLLSQHGKMSVVQGRRNDFGIGGTNFFF